MPARPRTHFLRLVMLMAIVAVGAASIASAATVDRFVDDDSSVHEGAINAVAEMGIVQGCNPPADDRFCPNRPLTRGEMATILVRVGELEQVTSAKFTDTGTSVHRAAIESLAAVGVTKGCNPPINDRFCPTEPLTRGELAAFTSRALSLPAGRDAFIDSREHMFAPEISALATAGIAKGCNPPKNDRFCPNRIVTRGEVASFVARALGLEPAADLPLPRPKPPATGGDYPGQPVEGTVLWGAAVGQNDDPRPRHEIPAGAILSLRRTFYQWNHRSGYMITLIEEDLAKGRLPWVSIKTPGWSEVASGARDTEIDQMLVALDRVSGPVWLTLHHEPEGGGGVNGPDDPGGPSAHLAMNRRVKERMETLGVDNVALAPILMSWTWDPASGRNPDDWWDPEVYDFVGVDHYACYFDDPDCQNEGLVNPLWDLVRQWADMRQVDVAVGEWGLRGTDEGAGDRVRGWFNAAARSAGDLGRARVVGLAAFDSDPYNTESFELLGGQLDAFHELMAHDGVASVVP